MTPILTVYSTITVNLVLTCNPRFDESQFGGVYHMLTILNAGLIPE